MVGFPSGNPNVNGLISQQAVKALLSMPVAQTEEGRTAATEWASSSEQLMKLADRCTGLCCWLHVKHGVVEQMEEASLTVREGGTFKL